MMQYGKNRQTGLSIVELMVGMVLGLLLTAGAIQLFISTKATYRLESALSRLQETGRFAVDFMADQIRMAGYHGCSSRINEDINVISNETPPLDATVSGNALRGYNSAGSNWNPALPAYITASTQLGATVLPGTDVLSIQHISRCSAALTTPLVGGNSVSVVRPNNCDFAQEDVVMINDCSGADIFAISSTPTTTGTLETLVFNNAAGGGGNTANTLSKNYDTDAQVSVYQSSVFYIATGANGNPALFQGTWDPAVADNFQTLELADNVQDMEILYGEDTTDNGAVDAYRTANAVINWENVRSVRIDLLLRSMDNVTGEPRAFTFNGANANAGNDHRLRIRHSITITLRNRLA